MRKIDLSDRPELGPAETLSHVVVWAVVDQRSHTQKIVDLFSDVNQGRCDAGWADFGYCQEVRLSRNDSSDWRGDRLQVGYSQMADVRVHVRPLVSRS